MRRAINARFVESVSRLSHKRASQPGGTYQIFDCPSVGGLFEAEYLAFTDDISTTRTFAQRYFGPSDTSLRIGYQYLGASTDQVSSGYVSETWPISYEQQAD